MYTHDTAGMGSGMPQYAKVQYWLPYHLLAEKVQILVNMANICLSHTEQNQTTSMVVLCTV